MDSETAKLFLKDLKKKKIPNIQGIDAKLMPRIKGGVEKPNELCIRVYVSKKDPTLEASKLIPKELDGVCTDVVAIGELKALDNKARTRPLLAGVSAMHFEGTACTLNGFYIDNETGAVLIASNNHCFAQENKASIGDAILQPSPYDGGTLIVDEVGSLFKYVEIKFTEFVCPYRNALHAIYRLFQEPLTNKVDIAFATIKAGVNHELAATYIGKIKGKREAAIGDVVQKTGRTTEHTTNGIVLSTSFVGNIGYSRGTAMFEDQILITGNAFSAGGDSGSPVFDQNGNLLGALFAGSDTTTVVCKIRNIEEIANVTLLTDKT